MVDGASYDPALLADIAEVLASDVAQAEKKRRIAGLLLEEVPEELDGEVQADIVEAVADLMLSEPVAGAEGADGS